MISNGRPKMFEPLQLSRALDASSAVENPGRVVSSRQRNPEMLPNFSNKLRFFLESSLGAFQVLD